MLNDDKPVDGQTGPPRPVNRYRRNLKANYGKAADELGQGLTESACKTLPLDQVFVKLILLAREDLVDDFHAASPMCGSRAEHVFRQAAGRLQTIHMENLFDVQLQRRDLAALGRSYRVLVLASAGFGKTTLFLKKAPLDWASGKVWTNYDLLIAREMRSQAVQQAQDIADLLALREHDILSIEDQQVIADFVREHPERVCLILDGLDEVDLEKCSPYVKAVIEGDMLHGIRLVITSRPSQAIFRLSTSRPFEQRVEVAGFQPDDLKAYIRKVLEAPYSQSLIRAVEADAALCSMLCTPFFAATTCQIYAARQELPKCVSAIFSSLVLHLMGRSSGQVFPSWQSVPPALRNTVLDIGSFAFRMLIDRRLIFNHRDLQEYGVSQAALRLGLLVSCEVSAMAGTQELRFCHLAMQEYLAAMFVHQCSCLDVASTRWLVGRLGGLTGHLNNFYMFWCAQESQEHAEALLASILLNAVARQDEADVRQLTDFLFASQTQIHEIKEMLVVRVLRPSMEKLARVLLGDLVTTGDAVDAVKESMAKDREATDERFLEALLLLWQRKNPCASRHMLYKALESVDASAAADCAELLVGQAVNPQPTTDGDTSTPPTSSFRPEDFKPQDRSNKEALLLSFRSFAERAAHHNGKSCAPIPIFFTILQHHGVLFPDRRLSASDCGVISKVLEYHNDQVKKIVLRSCGLDDLGMEQLSPGLKSCHHVEVLNVSQDRNLTTTGMVTLNDLIRNWSSTLTEITVRVAGDAGILELQSSLMQCPALSTLDVQWSDFTVASASILRDIITASPGLQELNISSNPNLGDEGVATILSALEKCHRFRKLWASRCGMTSAGAPALSSFILSQKDHLDSLGLSHNAIDDSGMSTLQPALSLCTGMREFYIRNNQLSAESVPAVSALLQRWPHAETLYLHFQRPSPSQSSDVTAKEAFIRAAMSCATLEELRLPASWVEDNGQRLPGLQRPGLRAYTSHY